MMSGASHGPRVQVRGRKARRQAIQNRYPGETPRSDQAPLPLPPQMQFLAALPTGLTARVVADRHAEWQSSRVSHSATHIAQNNNSPAAPNSGIAPRSFPPVLEMAAIPGHRESVPGACRKHPDWAASGSPRQRQRKAVAPATPGDG